MDFNSIDHRKINKNLMRGLFILCGVNMGKVKLTITYAKCRCGYHNTGDSFIIEDICPPLCHELWNIIYPSIYTLLNDGTLDYGEERVKFFDAKCPDAGRVCIHGEVISD
ncbi:hypothetical protein SDC9_182492 [bioreactor metagenome]|uniref:TIGR04076 family protein n=1 Tax=bioreactor metagenome TaxID=1076179 RepID=A0A645H7P7_9ZZZZ